MTKLQVIHTFVDTHTKEQVEVGVIDVTDDRAKELIAAGVAIKHKDLTVTQIKAELDDRQIEYDSKANKDELKALLDGEEQPE